MGNKTIDIQDLSLLKITRVRDWSISFDYDGRHYLIHGDSECGEGSWNDLYEKVYEDNGRYKLIHMSISWSGDEMVSYDYIDHSKHKQTIVYKQIDKEYFAYKLTKRGFATGIMENKVEEAKVVIAAINREIREYENKIFKLRTERDKWI